MAERAFETLKSLAFGPSTEEADLDDDLPHCLRDQTKSKFFPCLLCGKLFRYVKDLTDHGEVHQMGEEWPDEAIYCCYCGIQFPSKAGLIIHQSPKIQIKMSCLSCERIYTQEGLDTHVCSLSSGKSDCPIMDCSFRTGGGSNISSHLKLAHGCDNKVDVSIVKHTNRITYCPICGERFNECGSVGLDVHMSFHCPKVGDIQKAFIKSIYNQSKESGMDPDIVMLQELESALFDVLMNVEKVAKSQDTDEIVAYLTYILNRVSHEDFKQFLIDAVGWKSEKIYGQYDKLRDDFLLLFQVWDASVQYGLKDEQDRHRLASLYAETVKNEALQTLSGGPFSTVISKESVVDFSDFAE